MPQVDFERLMVGAEYERPQLAELWGYRSHHAISKDVVTPAGSHYIVLFVTQEKQDSLTQYRDYVDGDLLHWEGEERHGSDERIAHARENGDEIQLFYRERHHSPFVYMGPITLVEYEPRIDGPSRFVFRIDATTEEVETDPFEDVEHHEKELSGLDETTRRAIVQSRIGQGRFRRDVLDLWGGCAVTGIRDPRVLKASHVKPWRDATNDERLDPHNGLALIPNLDTLFDDGLITFDAEGRIRCSERIEPGVLAMLGIHADMRLRRMPTRLERYLRYYRGNVYRGRWDDAWGARTNGGEADG